MAGLHFLLLPLLIEIVTHYITFSQFVPNAIRFIVEFKRLYRNKRVVTSLALFRSLFVLKTSLVPGYPLLGRYLFSPCPKKKFKVRLPTRHTKWKEFFFCFL